MTIFNLSWKNILAKPLNTLMSVLLFALSVGLITFLTLFNHQFKQGLDNNLAGIDLVIGAKGSPLQLILNSMYHIDNPTGNIPISDASPFLNPQHPLISNAIPLCLGDSYGAYRIVGAPPSLLKLYGAGKVEGDVFRSDFDVVVGSVVAEQLHIHVGDHFYSTHGLIDDPEMAHDHGAPFVVKGILAPTGTVLDQLIVCTPQTVWKVHEHDSTVVGESIEKHAEHSSDVLHQHQSNVPFTEIKVEEVKSLTDTIISNLRSQTEREITSIIIQFKNRTNIQSLNFLRNINTNTSLMAASPALEINRLYKMLGSGTDAIRYIAILIAAVAAISIFISLYTSLKDRRYEMALMRVGGAGPGTLFQMILGEGLWIAILGCGIGLALGHFGMSLAGGILEKGYKYHFTGILWVPSEYWIIAGSILIGIIASVLPAYQGARTELHKTLAEG